VTDSRDAASRDKIAIIGIGCRLPGSASDYRAFWQNLINGKDCITPTPADRYDVATLGSRDKAKPGRLVGGRGGAPRQVRLVLETRPIPPPPVGLR
jgi:hybrid polyketide synthase/nonribosomal peptide synthetase FtdB